MFGLSLKITLNYVRRHVLATLLAAVGVALGVAVVAGIDGAIRSCIISFESTVAAISGGSTHTITHNFEQLADEHYIALSRNHPQILLAPVIDRYVLIERTAPIHDVDDPDNDANIDARVLGIDPLVDGLVRQFSAMQIVLDERAFADFLTEPGAAVIMQDLAERAELSIGETITINVGKQRKTLRIVGTAKVDGPFAQQLDDLILVDLATAQETFDMIGQLDRIDVIAHDQPQVNVLQAELPEQVSLTEISDRQKQLDQLIASYQMNLNALSLIGSFVAIFIVYNATLVSVQRRMRSLALMRCLGADRWQLSSLYLGEALFCGVLGVLLGLALGYVLAESLVGYVRATINDFYTPIDVPRVVIPTMTWIKAVGIGLFSALAGAAIPMIYAGRVPPLHRLRRSEHHKRTGRMAGYLALIALAGLGGAVLLLVFTSRSVWAGFAVALLVAGAFALLSPWVTDRLARGIAWLGRVTHRVPLATAGAAISRSLAITGTAVAAMGLAIAMNVSLLTVVGSFRTAVLDWLDLRFRADLFIGPELSLQRSVPAKLDAAVVQWAATQPETEQLYTYRLQPVNLAEGVPSFMVATQVDALLNRDAVRFRAIRDEPFDPARHVLVSEPLAGQTDWTTGDRVELPTPQGPKMMTVHGVFYDFASERGQVMVDHETFSRWWNDPSVNSLNVVLGEQFDVPTTLERWRSELGGAYPVIVQDFDFIKRETVRIFNRTFRVTHVLGWLTAIIAFCGLTGTLLALSIGRRREYAILRALGTSPMQTASWVTMEAMIIAVASLISGLVAGTILAAVVAWVIQYRSFGWSIPLSIQPEACLQTMAWVIGASLIAAAYPAWRVLRLSPATEMGKQP